MKVTSVAALLAVLPVAALAQEAEPAKTFPNRTIRMVVPFPPGGPADTVARFVAQRFSETWGQPAVVENRPGANTAIGAQMVAKSPPDGYTLLVGMDTTMVLNPLLASNLSYDPKEFAPVTLLANNVSLLVVRSDGPKTAKELIARAKANPGKLNMGAGTITSRLGALAFLKRADLDVQMIPYKGSAEIVQGVLSRSVDFAFDSVASSLPQIQSGTFRALAKYGDRHIPSLPDVPNLAAAADLPGLGESSTWIGILAPAATPAPVVDKLQREVAAAYADPAFMARLQKAGLFAVSNTPAEFSAFIARETARWAKFLQENGAGLKLE
jgi:tripartite-type tricarboxylate transporter receptor subunit TctC